MKKAAILWVERYEHVPLFRSEESAEDFAKELGVAGAELFRKKNSQVRDELFMPAKPGVGAPVDVAPILYYSGHGTIEGPKFNDGLVAAADEIVLGQNVSIAAFDCCLMLDTFEPWKQAFRGLRYMLGFTHSPSQHALRGPRFALRLKERQVISEAWRLATTETQASSWRSLRAFEGDTQPPEDVWPPPGPHSTAGPFHFVCRSADLSPVLAGFLGIADAPPKVPLFRTPKPERGELSPATLADKFRMDVQDPIIQSDKAKQIHARDSTLEIFEESFSVWWNRRYEQSTELFKGAPPPGALPRGKVVKLASLIFGQSGLKYLLGEPWETFTTETHETHDGSKSLTFQVARHLEFPLTLAGLPVLGPGARLRVSVQRGELSEFFLFSRRAVGDAFVPIMGPEVARRRLLNHATFKKVSDSVRIFRWSLGYYALSPREPQDHLVPVYAFEGIVSTQALPNYRFIRYVQAVPKKVREEQFPEDSVLRRMPEVFP